MNDQPDAKPSDLWNEGHTDICDRGPLSMKWMKSYATSIGVEDGCCDYVIKVYDNRAQGLYATCLPAVFTNRASEGGGDREVKNHVDEEAHS